MGTPGSLEEQQVKPRWLNWVPALAVHQPWMGLVLPLLEAVLDVTPSPCLAKCVITPVNVINVLWPGLAVSPPGQEGGRKGLSCPSPAPQPGSCAGSGPEDVLWCLQGVFTQLERPGGSQVCGCGTFREAFLFSSRSAGKEREEKNSSYQWDVEIDRNR